MPAPRKHEAVPGLALGLPRRSAGPVVSWLTGRNLSNILAQTAVFSVVAMGQHLLVLTRGIDLSVGSNVALASVVGALSFHAGAHRRTASNDHRDHHDGGSAINRFSSKGVSSKQLGVRQPTAWKGGAGKTVRHVRRFRPGEVLVEFTDGTRFFADTNTPIECSVTEEFQASSSQTLQ